MKRKTYNDYIRRFNNQDNSAFEMYLAPNMHMQNGLLEFTGIESMKAHYKKIWQSFTEHLTVQRFVGDEQTVAVQLLAHFTAHKDDPDSMFGPVQRGEMFDFRGVIIYQIEQEKFIDICVAYNSFLHTNAQGETKELGIPH